MTRPVRAEKSERLFDLLKEKKKREIVWWGMNELRKKAKWKWKRWSILVFFSLASSPTTSAESVLPLSLTLSSLSVQSNDCFLDFFFSVSLFWFRGFGCWSGAYIHPPELLHLGLPALCFLHHSFASHRHQLRPSPAPFRFNSRWFCPLLFAPVLGILLIFIWSDAMLCIGNGVERLRERWRSSLATSTSFLLNSLVWSGLNFWHFFVVDGVNSCINVLCIFHICAWMFFISLMFGRCRRMFLKKRDTPNNICL